MGAFVNRIKKGFSITPNDLILDNSISDRARFIFVYMASKPSDWDFYMGNMKSELKLSEDTVRKYIDELVRHGWVTKLTQSNIGGRFGATSYELNETPRISFSLTENTESEEFRDGEISTHTNKELNKEIIHNEEVIECHSQENFEKDSNKNNSEEKEKSCAKKEKEDRDLKFRDRVKSTVSEKNIEISDVEVNKFCNYWTESSEKQIKMRFEKQDAFDISKRLVTWIGNIKRDYPSNKHQRNFEQTIKTSLD